MKRSRVKHTGRTTTLPCPGTRRRVASCRMDRDMNFKRDWNQDGRVLTIEDAEQVIAEYRAAYSPARFKRLMEQASNHGHARAISERFEQAATEDPK